MLLHVPPEAGVQLIEVPLAPLGAYFPGLRPLLNTSPADVIATRTRWLDEVEQSRCRAVLERLSERQADVLRAFAEGLAPAQVADRLAITSEDCGCPQDHHPGRVPRGLEPGGGRAIELPLAAGEVRAIF